MLEMFGTKVIPGFDHDSIHSTTRYGQTARPTSQRWSRPIPEITIPVLPTNAVVR